MNYKSHSLHQTQQIAQNLAHKIKPGTIIALYGELGAGKTTLTQGLAQGLGIKDKIISPTFILLRSYPIPQTKNYLIHIDLYRLENIDQIASLGIKEVLENPENIVVIEWAEKLGQLLPKGALKINLKALAQDIREIQIS